MPDLASGIKLGILGGGQLGRMSALAAARLGISVVIFCPESDSPASLVAARTIIAAYDDQKALTEFANSCDYISYEFENIPVETIAYLETLKKNAVYPSRQLLEVSQDRVREKTFLNRLGIETAEWRALNGKDDYQTLLKDLPFKDFIIKTSRFGYDGKGQIKSGGDLETFFSQHKNAAFILESMVPFTSEISVIIARDIHDKTESYGPMLNEHKNHILSKTTVPAPLSSAQNAQALAMAQRVADAVNLVGVLTLEMFVHKDGRILANEIAPRTHNSGHWTIDACAVSQFEQHVRTVCGLPVGAPARHSDAVMLNLIGADIRQAQDYVNRENACVHLYGKHDIRDGRKMGHVTLLTPKT